MITQDTVLVQLIRLADRDATRGPSRDHGDPSETSTLPPLSEHNVDPQVARWRPIGRLYALNHASPIKDARVRAEVGGENRSRLRPARAERRVGSIRAERHFRKFLLERLRTGCIEASAPSWAGRRHPRAICELAPRCRGDLEVVEQRCLGAGVFGSASSI